jgi:arsenate reductase
MTVKRKVLFLCTGNSARSQMAEAIVNTRLGNQWEAVSAGTKPTGSINPYALRALEEIGIRHSGRSKSVEEFRTEPFDLVVTVCDSAAEECPVWLGRGKKVHLGFPDPAKASGSDEQKMETFRAVRDDIAQQIPALLQEQAGSDEE